MSTEYTPETQDAEDYFDQQGSEEDPRRFSDTNLSRLRDDTNGASDAH